MGQRLVVQIFDKGKRLANCYYHWSGYTSISASITEKIIDSYCDLEDEVLNKDHDKDMFLKAINILTSTGAGLQDEEEMNFAKNIVDKDFEYSSGRNNGLICVTEEGMDWSLGWSEATVNIDIGNQSVDFQAYILMNYPDYFDDNIWNNVEDIAPEKVEDEIITEDVKRLNQYFEEGLLTEYTKEDIVNKFKEEKRYKLMEIKDFPNVDLNVNLSDISFLDFEKVLDMFNQKCDDGEYSFTLNGNKDEIIIMIE